MKILLNKNKRGFTKNDILIIIFFIGLIVGTIFANIFRTLYINEINIVNDYFSNKLVNMDIEYGSLLKYILFSRIKYFIILWLFSITILGLPVIFIYLIYSGFLVGFIISISTMKYGIMGILLFIVYLFPHGIIYIPVIAISIQRAFIMCKRMYYMKNGVKVNKKNIILEYLFTIILLLVMIIIGCFIETYINSNILQSFLKNF